MALELTELPVALPAVWLPEKDSESRFVADQVAAKELDINTSTVLERLRRVRERVEVVVVACGSGTPAGYLRLFNGVVASGIEWMATKQSPKSQQRSARSAVAGNRVNSIFRTRGDESARRR